MASIFATILRGINRQSANRLNILMLNRNEKLQVTLAKTGHNFFFVQHPQLPQWDVRVAPIPNNCYILSGPDVGKQLKQDIQFDLILCQDRNMHYQLLLQIARQIGCPMLMAEYSLSSPNMNPYQVEAMASQEYNHSVFESEFLANSWGFDIDEPDITAIPQGIDTSLFHGWRGGDGKILTMVDHYQQEDSLTGFSLWREVTQGLPVNPHGDSPGLSKMPNQQSDLIRLYQNASVFLNTSTWQSCPISFLEAMAVGCPVITTATTILPDIIEDGINGYITNDKTQMRERLEELLADPKRSKELGDNARQTIIEKFDMPSVVAIWNKAFELVIDQVSCAFKI